MEKADKVQINAVMQLLHRGISVQPLLREDTKRILNAVCGPVKHNYVMKQLCKDALKVVDSNIFRHRDAFTANILDTISREVSKQVSDAEDGQEYIFDCEDGRCVPNIREIIERAYTYATQEDVCQTIPLNQFQFSSGSINNYNLV